jgi:sugar/nucleoside kinase (ribokinase family)
MRRKDFIKYQRYALVTGAASGMGRIYCQQLAQKGYNIIMVDINAAGLDETEKSIVVEDGLKILKEAEKRGIKTSIDLVSEHSDRYKCVLPTLPFVDNLIVNEVEAGALAGIEPTDDNLVKIAERRLELGVKDRVIIHSPKIGLVKTRENLTVLPSYELPSGFIKGTTGAGDAFCSGALLGIYEGLSDLEILEYASLAAIASLRAVDATSAVEEISVLKNTLGNLPRQNFSI